jgi:arylsulfatase A-like enzyme
MPTTLPAHASLFSSLYPSQLSSRRNGEKVSVKATMLAEILQSSDYATAAFVSASVMDSRYGLNQGFQTYEDAKRPSRPAVDALAKAKTWLKSHSADPFFLFMHFYDPHTFYHAPERFRNKFGAPNRKEPPERSFIKNPSRFTPQLVREVISAYDAEIAYADWATGELLRTLTQLGLDDHTLVILLSDHGESLDELIPRYGFAFGHGSFLYTYMLQIPMTIYIPRKIYQKENMIHATPVSIIDIMPTILDILQIESPGSIAGCSLLPMLRGERMSRGPIFSERRSFVKPPKSYLTGEDYSVVDENWHFMISTIRGRELYNLVNDPDELTNLTNENKKADILEDKLRNWSHNLNPLFGSSTFETDPEAIEKLRSLGYVD